MQRTASSAVERLYRRILKALVILSSDDAAQNSLGLLCLVQLRCAAAAAATPITSAVKSSPDDACTHAASDATVTVASAQQAIIEDADDFERSFLSASAFSASSAQHVTLPDRDDDVESVASDITALRATLDNRGSIITPCGGTS